MYVEAPIGPFTDLVRVPCMFQPLFLTSELAAFALKPIAGVMNKDMCEPDV